MSHEEENLSPGVRELEGALGKLRPASPRFTLEQMLAQAQLDRQRRRTRVWQAIAAVLAIAAAASFWVKPAVRTVEVPTVVYLKAPETGNVRTPNAEAKNDQPLVLVNGDFAYLNLRDKLLERGVNALRTTPEAPAAGRAPSMINEGRTGDGQQVQTPWYVDYLASGGRL
jgi:hypothetical protein